MKESERFFFFFFLVSASRACGGRRLPDFALKGLFLQRFGISSLPFFSSSHF